MGCFNSKDDRGTHMSYFRNSADNADERMDEASDALSEAESDARSAVSDVEDNASNVKDATEEEASIRHKQVILSKETTIASTSNARSAKRNSRARQRDIRRKALIEREAKQKKLAAAQAAAKMRAVNKKSRAENSNKEEHTSAKKNNILKSDGRRRSNKQRRDVEVISNGGDEEYDYDYTGSAGTRTMSNIPSLPSLGASFASESPNCDTISSPSTSQIVSEKSVHVESLNVTMKSAEDFYQGEEKHAIILSLALYSHNQAAVNTKANQLRTILLNYMNYEEEMITVVTNSNLTDDGDVYSYIESYLEESVSSSEKTHHFFIAIVTDNSISNEESYEKLLQEEQLPNDNMIIQIASITNEYTSFCFYLDTPFAGVLPTLKCRAIGDELLESPQPDQDIICSMIAISACSMRSFRGDPYVDAYGGENGLFTEQMAAFARSDRIEKYNWFAFAKQLQQRLDEPQLVSVAANKRHLLEMHVSL